MNRGRYAECVECFYYHKERANPICGECTAGEFFQERVRIRSLDTLPTMTELRTPTDDE